MFEQQLSERHNNTPMGIPHAYGNCDSVIKQSYEVGTVLQDIKTSDNNPDAALTPKRRYTLC